MTRTFEIVKELVSKMDLTIIVNYFNVVGHETEILQVCETLHLRKNSIVKDDLGNEYRVVDFVNNKSVTVEPLGNYVWSGHVIHCPKPTFLQGHSISTNQEYLQMSSDTRDKTPLIWLVRGYEEDLGGIMKAVKLNVTPLIFFLDEANTNQWTNDEHDLNAVNPMYNLAMRFIQTIKQQANIVPLEGFKIKDEPRFGVQINNQRGNKERILSDDLSGVGLRVNIKLLNNCKKC